MRVICPSLGQVSWAGSRIPPEQIKYLHNEDVFCTARSTVSTAAPKLPRICELSFRRLQSFSSFPTSKATSAPVQSLTTQMSYASPNDAVFALVSAARADDKDQLMQIFGPGAKQILSSGDVVADKQTRERFLQSTNR